MHRPLIASLGVISREIRRGLFYAGISLVLNNWFSGLQAAWIIRLRSSGQKILGFDLFCLVLKSRACGKWDESLREMVLCWLITYMQGLWLFILDFFFYLSFENWEYAGIGTRFKKVFQHFFFSWRICRDREKNNLIFFFYLYYVLSPRICINCGNDSWRSICMESNFVSLLRH